jgi:hypothetical protein
MGETMDVGHRRMRLKNCTVKPRRLSWITKELAVLD